VHGCAATPLTLLHALAKHGVDAKLKDVELIHIHTEGPGICVQPQYDGASSDVVVVLLYICCIIDLSCSYSCACCEHVLCLPSSVCSSAQNY